jgi:hypothetical protein
VCVYEAECSLVATVESGRVLDLDTLTLWHHVWTLTLSEIGYLIRC